MFKNVYVYAYTYMHVITMEKETVNLKENEKGKSKTLEGGKQREKICNYIIISKKNKKVKIIKVQWQKDHPFMNTYMSLLQVKKPTPAKVLAETGGNTDCSREKR